MASITSYAYPETNDNLFIEYIINHLRDNAKDENGNALFNRVDAGNNVPLLEIQEGHCNAVLVYRDSWQGDIPGEQMYVGDQEFWVAFQLFWYLASEGNDNPIDHDAKVSELRSRLIHWLEMPSDDALTDGMNWFEGSGTTLGKFMRGTAFWEPTNTYRLNGKTRELQPPIYSGVLRIKAKVWDKG